MKSRTSSCQLALAILIVGVAGCASAPQQGGASALVAPPVEGHGRVIFYRWSGIFGYGMRPDIFVDGAKVGRSVPGTRFNVDLPVGLHKVTVPNSVYSGERALEITVGNRETRYLRTTIGGSAFGGGMNIDAVDAKQGASEAEGLEVLAP